MPSVDNLITLAKHYVGYLGKYMDQDLESFTANPNGKYNMFASELDSLGDFYNGKKNGYDWCDVFYDWLLYKTFGKELALKLLCQPLKSLGAGVKYSAQYYKNNNQFFSTPQVGDQIFFGNAVNDTWTHTGIVTEVTSSYVNTVEGNAQATFNGIKYESAVAAFRYPLTWGSIRGYGRPNWNLIDQPTLTQEQFNSMMDVWLKTHNLEIKVTEK